MRKSKKPGIYIDLETTRNFAASLSNTFSELGHEYSLSIGHHNESMLIHVTDNTTTAMLCDDPSVFNQKDPKLVRVSKSWLAPLVFSKDAFYQGSTKTQRIIVDPGTGNSQMVYETTPGPEFSVEMPHLIPTCTLLYHVRLRDRESITAFLSGLGMLYGFGDAPGITVYKDRMEGVTISGSHPGMFALHADSVVCSKEQVHFEIPRSFSYVVLNVLLASKVHETPVDVEIFIYDSDSGGNPARIVIQSGCLFAFADVLETTKPLWSVNMPDALIDTMEIESAVAAMLFCGASAGLSDSTTTATLTRDSRDDQLSMIIPGCAINLEQDVSAIPVCSIPLTRVQVAALGYAIGAKKKDTPLKFLIGEDQEILISMEVGDFWMVRLK